MQHNSAKLISTIQLYRDMESTIIIVIWQWNNNLAQIKVFSKRAEIVVDIVAYVFEWTDIPISDIVVV